MEPSFLYVEFDREFKDHHQNFIPKRRYQALGLLRSYPVFERFNQTSRKVVTKTRVQYHKATTYIT